MRLRKYLSIIYSILPHRYRNTDFYAMLIPVCEYQDFISEFTLVLV